MTRSVVRILPIGLMTVALCVSCGPSKLAPLGKIPDCPTSIEGVFHHKPLWAGKAPMLLVEEAGFPEVIYGKIIEKNEGGIVFDRDRLDRFYDPGPRLYRYDRYLIAAVDSNRQVIHGRLPQKYAPLWAVQFTIRSITEPERKPYRFSVLPNDPFAYCIPAGTYQVTDILFYASNGDQDRGVDFPRIVFHVEEGKSNYIGDIHLDAQAMASGRSIRVPYKVLQRPTGLAVMQVVGGLIGSTLYGIAMAAEGVVGVHVIDIVHQGSFAYTGKNQGVVHLLNKQSALSIGKPTHISIWELGFYNNETPGRFAPEPIDYSSMVAIDGVDSVLAKYFTEIHQISLIPRPDWTFNERAGQDSLWGQTTLRMYEMLAVMDRALKSRAFSSSEQKLTWINMTPELNASENRPDSTVICVIAGLETLSRQERGNNYLHSGLGVCLFHSDGRYMGMAITEYDFTRYNTLSMIEQIIRNVEQILELERADAGPNFQPVREP